MKTQKLFARQGDVVIDRRAVTGELTAATDLVVAGGASHPHTIVGPCLTRAEGGVTLVRLASDTELSHAGGHRPVRLPAGDYHLWTLRERGDLSDRQVED